MVMGWVAYDMFIATLDDQQVTVLNAADELHPFTSLLLIDGFSELFVQIVDKPSCILCLEITSIVGDDLTILECNDITTDGEVVIRHLIADACRL